MAQVNLFAQIGSTLCRPDVEECVFHVITDKFRPSVWLRPFL